MNFKIASKKVWDGVLTQISKLGDQKHLASLRDGFALLIPLIIAGSLGIIGMTFVFGWYGTTSTSILGWITWKIPGQVFTDNHGLVKFVDGSVASQISRYGAFILYAIWNGIFSYLGIFAALTMSYSLARIKKVENTFIAAFVGVAADLILTYGDVSLLGSSGLLISIVASILSMELYSVFEKHPKLRITMPRGVPPAVARSFSKLLPTIVTLLILILFQAPFLIFNWVGQGTLPGTDFSIGKAIASGIQAPFIQIASQQNASYAVGVVYVLFAALLWFFGIHGPNVLYTVYTPIVFKFLQNNVDYITHGGAANTLGLHPSILAAGTTPVFIFMGGTGVTLAFVLMGFLFSRKKADREIFKFGVVPGIFQVNEPILFGIPLILNFLYFVPFIFTGVVLFTITWLAISVLKIVPPVIVLVPWTTPLIIGGFLATSSWQGALLSLFNILVAFVIWSPFIFIANLKAKKSGEELIKIDYRMGAKKFIDFFNKNKNSNSHPKPNPNPNA